MSSWLHRYSTAHSSSAPDLDAHYFFYQLAQLLFYVVTLQQQRLFSSEEGREWFRSLGFDSIVFSSLNPLRVCPCHLFASPASLVHGRFVRCAMVPLYWNLLV
jgi:hypothetical protein